MIIFLCPKNTCGYGGTGRRAGFRFQWETVEVQILLAAPQGTHAKGAYKTPPRVSFSMQNRGKLPFSWQFTLFVVSSHIAVGICSSLGLRNGKPLTIAQKGFLLDKEHMTFTDLINDKNGRLHYFENSRSFAYKVSLTGIPYSKYFLMVLNFYLPIFK